MRELSANTFNNEVLYDGNVSIVAFYAPWCGYCKQLAPELKQAAKSLKGIARVSAVNCDSPMNQPICQRYKVQGYPTIKVFQPSKLTDVDFKDAVGGKSLPRRRPKMFAYNGPRTASSLTEFAIGKLRNYAATLGSDDSLKWLAPNLVPRVVMLPGKKYKSRSVSPLFKVLSREYFGKIRFATIPRRVDGAWNLLGLEAPEESQLVYMSDDREPVIYKGNMKKKPIKAFIDEQYQLEMHRRKHSGKDADIENAANGMEYVVEDAQTEELEHVKKRNEMMRKEHEKARQARKDAFIRAGIEFDEAELDVEPDTTSTTTTPNTPRETSSNEDNENEEEEAIEFEESELEYDKGEDSNDEESDDDDIGEAELDEAIIDVKPEEMVEEGAEALEKYLNSYKESQMAEPATSTATKKETTKTTPTATGGTDTSSATPLRELGLKSYDTFVDNCLRRGYHCAVAVARNDTLTSDLSSLARVVKTVPNKIKRYTLFEFFIIGEDPTVDGFLESIGAAQAPGMFFYDAARQKVDVMTGDYLPQRINEFLLNHHKKKRVADTPIPAEYLYWVTQSEIEAKRKEKQASANEDDLIKDEL